MYESFFNKFDETTINTAIIFPLVIIFTSHRNQSTDLRSNNKMAKRNG